MPHDQGLAVIVMDREHYISEAERQLTDSTFYKALDHDPSNAFAKKAINICEMRNCDHISERNAIYLIVDRPNARRIYPLPKQNSQSWKPWTFNSVCQKNISELVDLHLQPHVQNLPPYLQECIL